MITVIGLSGSLRRGSFNTAVLRAGGSLMPADSELRIESIEGIPLYNVSVRARHLARARYFSSELLPASSCMAAIHQYRSPGG